MDTIRLTIFGRGKSWEKELNPKGTIIGRIHLCDVVLESRKVSREHARIFRDPFGRWIVEDLGSSNGTFVNGKRIEVCPILPGEILVIDPFYLSVSEPLELQIKPDSTTQDANIVVEDFETEVFPYKDDRQQPSVRPCPDMLSEFTELLSGLTSPSALYPEVCRFLGRVPHTVAVILRVPEKSQVLPKSPDILACYFGDDPYDSTAEDTHGFYPSLTVLLKTKAFRLSHSVLEAVRCKEKAAMAKTIYSSDAEITSTLIDEHSPRAVICAPLGKATTTLDLLYLDLPIGESMNTTPEEVFDFVCTVAQEVTSNRKKLILGQLKAERSALDCELSLAQQIQSTLVPRLPEDLGSADVAVGYKPVTWVGSDYHDVWRIEDGRLAFAVGQIADRGIRAAMAKCKLKCALRIAIRSSYDLATAIRNVNEQFIEDWPGGLSASLFLGLVDTSTGNLEYINLCHPEPLVIQPNSVVEPFGEASVATLGKFGAKWQTSTGFLLKGATLAIFTRGSVEAPSPDGEHFGLKRIMHLLRTKAGLSATQIAKSVVETVIGFQQKFAQQEDVTVLVVTNRLK